MELLVRIFIVFSLMSCLLLSQAFAALHDPTAPQASDNAFEGVLSQDASKIKTSFNLQSILLAKARRLVMINGKLLGVGSEIEGARILAIDKNRVVLLQGNRKITLYLFDKTLWIPKK